MGIIFLAVLLAASLLYAGALGKRWLAGCWLAFTTGSVLAGLDIAIVPFFLQSGAALAAAVRGVLASSSSTFLNK